MSYTILLINSQIESGLESDQIRCKYLYQEHHSKPYFFFSICEKVEIIKIIIWKILHLSCNHLLNCYAVSSYVLSVQYSIGSR